MQALTAQPSLLSSRAGCSTLATNIAAIPELSTLLELAINSGYAAELDQPGRSYTLLAPTNDAFAALEEVPTDNATIISVRPFPPLLSVIRAHVWLAFCVDSALHTCLGS